MNKKLVGLLTLCLILFCTVPVMAKEHPNVIISSATENMEVEPDMVTFSAAVATENKKAEKAIEENNIKAQTVQKVVNALLDKEDKIKTTRYTVKPVYKYNRISKKNELTGYRVSNRVQVETKQVDKVGKLIQAALNAGANDVDSLVFSVRDDDKYRTQLLGKASTSARKKADVIAKALGVKIIGVKSVNFGGNRVVATPMYRGKSFAMEADAAAPQEVPVSPGEIEINVSVTVEFLIQN